MKHQLVLIGLLLTSLWSRPGLAAWEWFDLPGAGERLVTQAEAARERGDLHLAGALLDEAEREVVPPRAHILMERGLLAEARGELDAAATLLGRAADADGTLPARVLQAGVLVGAGKWPEAVVTLRRAFSERGSALRVDEIVANPRFSGLATFEPYTQLLTEMREEQAGPLARVLLRLERVEASVLAAESVLSRLALVLTFLWRLGGMTGAAVVVLLTVGMVFAAGVAQLGVLMPPKPLWVGMTLASVLWLVAAYVGTAGQALGVRVVGAAWEVVLVPYLLAEGARRWRARRHAAQRGSSKADLLVTLALLQTTTRLVEEALATGEIGNSEFEVAFRTQRRALLERLR